MEQLQTKRIGQILKEKRNQLGYTQEFAAERIGISYSYYTKIERGEQLPSLEVCIQIAQTFHLSMDYWLLGDAAESVSSEQTELLECIGRLSYHSVREVRELFDKISTLVIH